MRRTVPVLPCAGLRLHRLRMPTALALSFFALLIPTMGHAKVEIEGVESNLRVRASGEAISEILAALSAVVSVRYRTPVSLDSKISGTYSGSVEQVIARLLRDYNFVIDHKGEVIEVSVYGAGRDDRSTQELPLGPAFPATAVEAPIGLAPIRPAPIGPPVDDSRLRPAPPLPGTRSWARSQLGQSQ